MPEGVKMDKKPVTFNPQAITKFAKKGEKFIMKKEAEAELLKLLQVQALVERLVKQTKEAIANAGLKIDKGFRGVIGENIRAVYRVYGEKYTYDRDNPPEDYLKSTTYWKPDSTKIDDYYKKTGELPKGISEKNREPVLSISITDKELLNETTQN